MYNGFAFLDLSGEDKAKVYDGAYKGDFKANQYLILKNDEGKAEEFRWDGNKPVRIKYSSFKDFKPKSAKQRCLADLLCNTEIPIKIIAGVAGSGKTKFCVKYGLEFLRKGIFEKLFVVRHNVSVGEKNGYLPGSKIEKIRGWLGFLEDNLDDVQETIEDLIDNGKLEVDSPEFMKGRDLKNAFILIDEAEDLTEEQFKMLGERVSAGSVICFVGDYEQTTQEKYRSNNGLIRGINKLSGSPLVGIVVFDDKEKDNMRSETSKVFSYLY